MTISDCTFARNAATDAGSSLYVQAHASPSITNTILSHGEGAEAVSCWAGDYPSLVCCDVYGNAGGDWMGCIADQYGVNGNFSVDPLFCGDLNPDEPYTLHADSPCAPDNNPECGLLGAWGVACDLTAVEPVSWGAIKAMFR